MRIIFILFLFVLFFSKCYTPSYEKEFRSIDSLEKAYCNYEQLLKTIDTSKIGKQSRLFSKNMQKLKKNKNINISNSDKSIENEYKSLNEMFFKTFKSKYIELSEDVIHSKDMLYMLKGKVENGMIPMSSYLQYIRGARLHSLSLIKKINLFVSTTYNYSKSFEKLNTKIEKIKQAI